MSLGIKTERRIYPRFRKEVKVFLRELDSMSKYEVARTKDVALGGFRIGLKEKRNVGEVIEIMIIDPFVPDSPIKAFGRIAWIKKQVDRGIEAGIRLTYLAEKDRDRFKKLLSKDNGLLEPDQIALRSERA